MENEISWYIKGAMDKAFPNYKLDMLYFENNDKVGMGGIARDRNGDFLFAFAAPIQCKDHNSAEVMAAKFAVQWITNRGHKESIVEMDSMIVINMMNEKTSHNLDLSAVIEDTIKLINNANIQFSHCYIERPTKWKITLPNLSLAVRDS
ncbi:hypothetical protein HAX54_017533 [Datura stramonium]|uniref:RNase H type-1 domain-containing protein n=1 Tax=Datura stramonium TaxID=4076 RepID=A0ABS8UMX5_DATST|nr:hypothetical protein [Datura stramonium]